MTVSGVLFYQGPSRIDGGPIVAVATLQTANVKTGDVVQTWILRSDRDPVAAARTGADASVCGDCPLRGRVVPGAGGRVNVDRGCYVNLVQAPLAVYRAWAGGRYPGVSARHGPLMAGRPLRYGSYGDPVAVPTAAWRQLSRHCAGGIGYTHQWADPRFRRWRKYLMASTHSEAENARARAAGWRTFRTLAARDELTAGEVLCPASAEGGFRRTCRTCGACDGSRGPHDGRVGLAIVAHGSFDKAGHARRVSLSLA